MVQVERRRVALVTGGARGIGREIALALARQGYALGLCDILPQVADTRRELEGLGVPAVATVADICQEDEVSRVVAEVAATLGPVDLLVNNAGVVYLKPLVEHSTAEWDHTFNVGVRGAFLMCRSVLPGMIERRDGLIVNISSIWGSRGGPNRSAYIAAKHAVLGLTRALAEECRPHRVRVVAVSPGPVRTEMTASFPADQSDWLEPREIGDVVAFLAGQGASGITGAAVDVFGFGRPAGL